MKNISVLLFNRSFVLAVGGVRQVSHRQMAEEGVQVSAVIIVIITINVIFSIIIITNSTFTIIIIIKEYRWPQSPTSSSSSPTMSPSSLSSRQFVLLIFVAIFPITNTIICVSISKKKHSLRKPEGRDGLSQLTLGSFQVIKCNQSSVIINDNVGWVSLLTWPVNDVVIGYESFTCLIALLEDISAVSFRNSSVNHKGNTQTKCFFRNIS